MHCATFEARQYCPKCGPSAKSHPWKLADLGASGRYHNNEVIVKLLLVLRIWELVKSQLDKIFMEGQSVECSGRIVVNGVHVHRAEWELLSSHHCWWTWCNREIASYRGHEYGLWFWDECRMSADDITNVWGVRSLGWA